MSIGVISQNMYALFSSAEEIEIISFSIVPTQPISGTYAD